MPSSVHLLDSSFLFALFAQDAKQHAEAQAFAELSASRLLALSVTLPEVTFLFQRAGGSPAVRRFLSAFTQAQMPLETVTYPDLVRAEQLIAAYPEAELDFVDVCLMAYAERQDIRRICTYDYRDFSLVKPAHVDSFIILPLQYDQL